MRVVYFSKRSMFFILLMGGFVFLSWYFLIANFVRAPGAQVPSAPASDKSDKSDKSIKGQQYPGLLPVLPDLSGQEFFVECRLARDRSRSQQMETLREIAEQSNSSGEVRDNAQRELMKLSDNISKETELEKLVLARGFKDAAVIILPRSATVIVQVRAVTPSEVEQVRALVAKATDLDAGSVFVISKV